MKPTLVGIYSSDLPEGPVRLPDDASDCWVVMQADIGSDAEPGADAFTFHVTTPKFLARSLETDGHQLGRGLVVVPEFDWQVVEAAVLGICAHIEADSWSELVGLLSRHFFYEFE